MLGARRVARGFGCGHFHAVRSAIAFVVMRLHRHCRFRLVVMCHRATRRLQSRSKPLEGQRGYQQPEQKCLEDAGHFGKYTIPCSIASAVPYESVGLPTMGMSTMLPACKGITKAGRAVLTSKT